MEKNLFSSSLYRESNDVYLKSLGQDYGNLLLGQNTSRILVEDPKLLLFTLSRYKFVSKMLSGSKSTLEIGCQEGFGANLLFPVVENYYGVDFYKPYIKFAQNNCRAKNAQFFHGDILDHQIEGLTSRTPFESCFALDVLEHIDAKDEDVFMLNVLKMLHPLQGKLIIGMPSLESQIYASEASRKGHINCKTSDDLRSFASKYFNFVFMFSLNDEVMHTGFGPMSHYILALCASPRNT